MAELEVSNIEGAGRALRHPDLAQALYDAGAVIMDGALVANVLRDLETVLNRDIARELTGNLRAAA